MRIYPSNITCCITGSRLSSSQKLLKEKEIKTKKYAKDARPRPEYRHIAVYNSLHMFLSKPSLGSSNSPLTDGEYKECVNIEVAKLLSVCIMYIRCISVIQYHYHRITVAINYKASHSLNNHSPKQPPNSTWQQIAQTQTLP